MIFLDSGYFIAIFSPTDQLHARAVAWSQVLKGRFLVTAYVLWECVNHFSARAARPRAHSMLAHVRTNPVYELVPASPGRFQAAVALHEQSADKDWSLTDCASFNAMREHGITEALA